MIMAPARVFGAIAGRAFMVAVAKSVVKKKPAPSNRATVKVAVKKTVAPRTTNSGIQKVVPVFFEVGDFLGAPQVSQTEAVNKVWAYIKLQNLQLSAVLVMWIALKILGPKSMEPAHKIVMIVVGQNILLLWAFHGSCWSWGSLASSHSLDIAGLELVDPLSTNIQEVLVNFMEKAVRFDVDLNQIEVKYHLEVKNVNGIQLQKVLEAMDVVGILEYGLAKFADLMIKGGCCLPSCLLMQSYPPRVLDRRLQEDWARATKEGPRVLMNLRVDF
ncbi:Centromere/kinetochore protein zw10-like [Glycine soja]|uniref:Centromere/kinetochore protein zw10-like n=1 Tax=Glycine soja TaxID=3848 RepID=A0A445JKV7_GLYSO|nr:Centromere/kinetochore protein zw10-like [Glycine soja]